MVIYCNLIVLFLIINFSFILSETNNDNDILFDIDYFKNSLKIKNEEIYNGKYSCIDNVDNDFSINNNNNNNTTENNLKRFLIYDFKINNNNSNMKDYINSKQNVKIDIHILNELNETIKSNIVDLHLIRDSNCINGIDDISYYNRKYYRLGYQCYYIKKNDMYTECQFLDITDIKMENIKLNIKFIDQNFTINIKLSKIERYSHYTTLESILIVIFFPFVTLTIILISYVFNNLLFLI